jgi:hypothetical protein
MQGPTLRVVETPNVNVKRRDRLIEFSKSDGKFIGTSILLTRHMPRPGAHPPLIVLWHTTVQAPGAALPFADIFSY